MTPRLPKLLISSFRRLTSDGVGTYDATDKVTITGIVLNNPEEMLDPTPSTSGMGGQWQVYIEGEGSDHAGTAVYMAQNYVYDGRRNYILLTSGYRKCGVRITTPIPVTLFT